MTNPFDPSIQSQKNADQQPISGSSENFSLRTMRDDLMFAPKKIAEKETIPHSPVFEAPQKQDSSKNTASETAWTPQGQSAEKKESAYVKKQEPKTSAPTYGSFGKMLKIISLFLVIIVFIGLGIYYFLTTRTTPETTSQPVPPVEDPVIITPVQEKYSQEKPNYLPLDIATIGPEDIKASIKAVAEELKEKVNQKPYEFIVVDANNNPVAFPIFATAVKFNLSPDLLENLEEDFSLFFYNDNGYIRLSVLAKIKDKNIVSSELLKQEGTLVSDADFLLLGVEKEISTGEFQKGDYNGAPIRFLNLNGQINLSIDYSIVENRLIIATSKNSMRAILDKLLTKDFIFINEQTPKKITEDTANTAATVDNENKPIGTDTATTLTPEQIAQIEDASKKIGDKIKELVASPGADVSAIAEMAKATALEQPAVESAEVVDGQLSVKYKNAGTEAWPLKTTY